MKQMIKSYNVKKYMEESLKEHNITTFCYDDKYAILSNDKGKTFMITIEGVYYICDIEEEFEISLCDFPTLHEDGSKSISIMPQYSCNVAIKELINNCDVEEMYLQDFVRTFGDRLEMNYHNIINDITNTLEMNGMEFDNGRLFKNS